MENKDRLAIGSPQKIKLIRGYQLKNCTLVANKGDFWCKRYGFFGEKLYHDHDVWNFHVPFHDEMVVDDDPAYVRIGDELFVKPRVLIVYGNKCNDEKYFDSD